MAAPPQDDTVEPDHLSDLPPELFVHIFSSLPVKDMFRGRRLSHHIRNLIDANEAQIVCASTSYHQRRLHQDYDTLVNTGDIEFVALFKRYLGYYGTAEVSDTSLRLCRAYVFARYSNRLDQLGVLSEIASVSAILSAAVVWVLKGQVLANGDAVSREEVQQALIWKGDIVGDDNLEKALSSIKAIMEARYPYIWTTSYCMALPADCSWAGLSGERKLPRPDKKKIRSFTTLLGVPLLAASRHFCYCAESDSIVKLAFERTKRDAKEATILEKAAILEEMFIW